jgi:Trk K+ transport system NAD-binding subunit
MPLDRAISRIGAPGRTDHVVVVGGGEVGRTLAVRLVGEYRVTLLDDGADPTLAERHDVDVYEVDVTDGSALRALVLDPDVVVAAAEHDRVNLLAMQLVRSIWAVEDIVVRVNDPENETVFETIEVETVSTSALLAAQVTEALDGTA